jgi:alpha,alpha-trehalose phosphorylase
VRYGTLVSHRRTLDLRAGVLRRDVHWRSPAGREVEIRSVRLVSFVHRSVAAVRYEVKPLDGETRIVVQSEIVPLLQEYWFDDDKKVDEQRAGLLA